MRFVIATLLAVHGAAHLVGFRAAFWAPTVSVLNGAFTVGQLGARALAAVWLLLAGAFVASAALFLARSEAFESAAWCSTGVSLVLCGLFWPDARWGWGVDIVVLLALFAVSRSNSTHLERAFRAELARARLPLPTATAEVISDASTATLPAPVKRYLAFMGVFGRPRDWSLKARFNARFRRATGPWLECEALQYDNRLELSRVFYMQLALQRLLPVTVRDTYLAGNGRMTATALDLLNVVDVGGPELDRGELVTYLNDAILLAPSLLLGPETSWTLVNERCFDVSLRDRGLTVSARVWLDDRGAPVDFRTTDRFFQSPDGKLVRTEWRTPVAGWQAHAGRMLPTRATAVWHLPSGPFAYADFSIDPQQLTFNVSP
jgi:hypothetical protein